MGRNFGGLGAWGMFMALIAVFALAFTGPDNDSRKKYDDATQAFNWTTEPAPPLIVSSVEDLVSMRTNALIVDGITLAVPSVVDALNTDSIQKTTQHRRGVKASVLLCYQVAAFKQSYSETKRNLKTRHRFA